MDITKNRFQVDYLTFTVFSSPELLSMILQEWNVDKDIEWLSHGARGYERIAKTSYGLTVYIQPIKQKDVVHDYFTVELSSTAIQKLAIMHVLRVLDGLLKKYRVNINRLDLAVDTQSFRVRDFWNYLEDAYDGFLTDGRKAVLETRFHKENIRRITNLTGDGDTVYVGSRESTAMLRVYRKTVLDDGMFQNEPFTRVELELKDTRALASIYKLLMTAPKDWHYHFVELLNGMLLLGWQVWNDWLGSSSKWWLRLIQIEPSFDRAARWIRKQIAPSLAMVARSMADSIDAPFDSKRITDYFASLCREGDKRLTSVQRQIVQMAHVPSLEVAYHDRRFTSWGAKYDDLLVSAVGRMKNPPSLDMVKAAEDWEKRYLLVLDQVPLPGVNWDEYVRIKNWTCYEI